MKSRLTSIKGEIRARRACIRIVSTGFIAISTLAACGNGTSDDVTSNVTTASNTGSGSATPSGARPVSDEPAYCDGAVPTDASDAVTASRSEDGRHDNRVSALVLKLQPSSAGANDSNDPLRVASVVHSALIAAAKQDSQNPFATAAEQAAVRPDHQMSGGAEIVLLGKTVRPHDADALLNALKQDPAVDYAELNRVEYTTSEATLTPNDQDFGLQWNLNAPDVGINAPVAWAIQKADPGVVTAVIDTGYLPQNDLDGNRVSTGLTMLPSRGIINTDALDLSPSFESGHGTQVAGLISSVTDNGEGIAGVGWNAKFLPINVFNGPGANASDIADAIRWAAGMAVPNTPINHHPVKIINLSLGAVDICGPTNQTAIDDVVARGVTVVVAAGNENMPASRSTPANCNNVITVAGTNELGQRHSTNSQSGSNYGRAVSVSAPGRGVLTSTRGLFITDLHYTTVATGTSFAAPQVAGVVALMLSANPNLTPAQVKQILQDTAKKPKLGVNEQLCTQPEGAGIVDAGAAVLAAKTQL